MTDDPLPQGGNTAEDEPPMGRVERRILRAMTLFWYCFWPLCLLLTVPAAYRKLAHLGQADFWAASESVFFLLCCAFLGWQSWHQWRSRREGDAVFALLVWLGLLIGMGY